MGWRRATGPSTPPDIRCQVPGARVQQLYGARVVAPPGHVVVDIEMPSGHPLQTDRSEPVPKIVGVPNEPGRVPVKVTLQNGQGKRMVADVNLVVAPDPESLWQDLPPDMMAVGAKPVTAIERVVSGVLDVRGGSVRGRAHANRGEHREDDFALWALANGGIGFALADGAGSAPLARMGSSCAVKSMSRSLAGVSSDEAGEDDLRDALVAAVRAALSDLEELAASLDASPEDFNTTLIIGLCLPSVTADRCRVLAWQVGDGLVAVIRADDILVVTVGDHGDYTGQTRFLQGLSDDPEALARRCSITEVKGFHCLIGATDGVIDPFVIPPDDIDQPVTDMEPWRPIIGMAEAAFSDDPAAAGAAFMESLSVFTPGDHDDRTLVVVRAREGASS